MKRSTAFFLALLLALATCSSALAMDASNVQYSSSTSEEEPVNLKFTDSDKINSKYAKAIAYVTEKGIIDGYADGSFGPQFELTRQAAAKLLANMLIGPTKAIQLTATTAPFQDVPASSLFAGYIALCSYKNYIGGYGDGNFRPTARLTTAAFGKMLLNLVEYKTSTSGYTGDGWMDNVYQDALACGIFTEDMDFGISDVVTREEAAFLIYNTLTKVPGVKIDAGNCLLCRPQ